MIARVVAAAVVGALIWFQGGLLTYFLGYLFNIGPIVSTYIEMESFRPTLKEYVKDHDGAAPSDLGRWLNTNFASDAKSDMSIDYFGTPYEIDYARVDWFNNRAVSVRSCGIDGSCDSRDDLVLSLE